MKHTSAVQNDLGNGASGVMTAANVNGNGNGGVFRTGGQKIDAVMSDVFGSSPRTLVNKFITGTAGYMVIDYMQLGQFYIFEADTLLTRGMKNQTTSMVVDVVGNELRKYTGIYI